jgi:Cytochrome C oxidase, cbb3-type, subunit III
VHSQVSDQNKPLPIKLIAGISGIFFFAIVFIFGILPSFFDIYLFENKLLSEEKTALKQAGILLPKEHKRGEYLFTQYCESCHGNLGQGNGPTSRALRGKMPSFFDNSVVWKNGISTPENILKTLQEGVPNTEMPSFKYLPAESLVQISGFTAFLSNSGVLREK